MPFDFSLNFTYTQSKIQAVPRSDGTMQRNNLESWQHQVIRTRRTAKFCLVVSRPYLPVGIGSHSTASYVALYTSGYIVNSTAPSLLPYNLRYIYQSNTVYHGVRVEVSGFLDNMSVSFRKTFQQVLRVFLGEACNGSDIHYYNDTNGRRSPDGNLNQ